ncbi:MAG: alpha/beta hydrolase [Planctomycetes bacterium]|nr:alpha/beta hydrolase [Planctomycetota bacterium]
MSRTVATLTFVVLMLSLAMPPGCAAPSDDPIGADTPSANDGTASGTHDEDSTPRAGSDTTASDAAPRAVRHRTAPFGDILLHYDDVGTGPRALVFVHGWACDRSVWREQVPALADVMRCIALDLPGHGESAAPDLAESDYTMDLFADAVLAVMDAAGVEQAVLVGHSNGAPVVRQVLRRHPERVAALVLVDGTLRYAFDDRASAEQWVDEYRQPAYREVARQMIQTMLRPEMPSELKADITQRMLRTPQTVMVGAFEAAVDPALYAPDPIDVPLLCVLAKSPFWTEDYERYVLSLAPGADYVVLADVGHFLMLDAPERFDALVRDFVWAWDLAR